MSEAPPLPNPQLNKQPSRPRYSPVGVALLLLSMMTVGFLVLRHKVPQVDQVDYAFFIVQVQQRNVSEVDIYADRLTGKFKNSFITVSNSVPGGSTQRVRRKFNETFQVRLNSGPVDELTDLLVKSDVTVRLRSRN